MRNTPLSLLILMLTGCVCICGLSLVKAASTTDNRVLVYEYGDFFDTNGACDVSDSHSIVWVDGAFPPNRPHILFKTLDENNRAICFRGDVNNPAELRYRLPVNPIEQLPPIPLFMEVEVGMSPLPGILPEENSGSLECAFSDDEITWSTPQPITQENGHLEFSFLSGSCYLRFRGQDVLMKSFYVALFRSSDNAIRVSTKSQSGVFTTIQSAIDAAIDSNTSIIVVADGTYRGPGNRAIDFKGHDITLISENGPEGCIIDCQYSDRAFIFTSGESRNTLVHGLTISKGQSNKGGGIYCQNSQPTLSCCKITDCRSIADGQLGQGGGIYCMDASPLIHHCEISSNNADSNIQGGQGGGIFLNRGAAVIEDCTIYFNRADNGDSLDNLGGGIYITGLSGEQTEQPVIKQCVFSGNWAEDYGGALAARGIRPEIINCTVVDNTAQTAGGMYIDTAAATSISAKVKNCIIWNNHPDEFIHASGGGEDSGLVVTYCNIKGEKWPGTGNQSGQPYFADEDNYDFHLQSLWGRWDPTSKTWIRDYGTSPYIDGGDPNDAIGYERYPHGLRINMGAYGGSSQASRGRGSVVFHVDIEKGDDMDHGQTREAAFQTIQTAIDVSREDTGDAILVWPGTYIEEADFQGKAIILQSAADAAVLQAPERGTYAVSFYIGEVQDSILRNFIIKDSPEGGVFCHNSSPTLDHLTLEGNRVGIKCFEASNPIISNCILWDNIYGDLEDCQAQYSCIERIDQSSGEGNISTDPLFADPDNGDYHLQSQFGRYVPGYGSEGMEEATTWVIDDQTSPCIDAGDPNIYPQEEPAENGNRLNLGAYGGTAYASKSPPPQTEILNIMAYFGDFFVSTN